MKKIVLIISALLVFIFFSIFIINRFVYSSMFTKISPRPEKSIGWLWVNPFILNNHLENISNRFNISSDLAKGWKIRFADLGIGFYKMGESGISYKCEQKGKSKTMLVSIDENKVNSERDLLAKRIYWNLLFCSASAEKKDGGEMENYLSGLVFVQTKISPVLIF